MLSNASIGGVFGLIVIGTGMYYKVLLPMINRNTYLLNLFSLGKTTSANIIRLETRQIRAFPEEYIIYYEYYDEKRIKWQNLLPIFVCVMDYVSETNKKLVNNDMIRIIFLQNNPKYGWLYTEKLNDIYNIRKG